MEYKKGDVVYINRPKQRELAGLYVVKGWDKLSLFADKLKEDGTIDERVKFAVTPLASPYIYKTKLTYQY